VQWFDWIALLGGREFDLFVDPGCVSVRYTDTPKLVTIWADEIPSPLPVTSNSRKTLAQQLMENDNEDDEIFSLIKEEVHGKHWLAPPINPSIPIRPSSPLSALSAHSRCSSRSSNSSSGLSLSSIETSPGFSPPPKAQYGDHRQSRRERARQSRIYVDKTKNEVTPYDGGKTTVLTGGVMLGGGSGGNTRNIAIDSDSWRSGRA